MERTLRWWEAGEVVGFVDAAFLPINVVLPLSYSVADPVESHVNGLRTFLFDSVVGNPGGGAVVSLYGGGWLGMAHFGEGCSDGTGVFEVVEEAAEFHLQGTCKDLVHDLAKDQDGMQKSIGSDVHGEGATQGGARWLRWIG